MIRMICILFVLSFAFGCAKTKYTDPLGTDEKSKYAGQSRILVQAEADILTLRETDRLITVLLPV